MAFINTEELRQPAIFYQKHGRYDCGLKGSRQYKDYWNREKKRCEEGYTSPTGISITGMHYEYLNYSQIEVVKEKENKKLNDSGTVDADRYPDFPDFWEEDYKYFWILYIAKHGISIKRLRELEKWFDDIDLPDVHFNTKRFNLIETEENLGGGKHMCWVKPRGCGASWKGAEIPVHRYFHGKANKTFLLAEDKTFLTGDGLYTKFLFKLNFINTHTEFAQPNDYKHESVGMHYRASYHDSITNTERGLMNEVIGESLKDDPEKARGKRGYILWEECFGKGTKVIDGDYNFKNVEDIKVGDLLLCPDSKKREVLRTSIGIDDLYKIIPKKGKPYIVNSQHQLHIVINGRGKNYDGIKKIKVIDYINKNKDFKKYAYKQKSSCINFPEQDFYIDSYLLGLWLGDGSKNDFSIVANNTESNIINTILENHNNNDLIVDKYDIDGRNTNYTIKKEFGKRNPMNDLLRYYNLINNKHIPKEYLYNTKETRLQILAGLLDTDGYLASNSNNTSFYYEISQSNEQLAIDIEFLCRSLGFAVNRRIKKTKCKDSHRISICGNIKEIPVRVERKKVPNYYENNNNPLLNSFDIEYIGKGDYYSFTIETDENENKILLEDFTIEYNCGKFRNLASAYNIAMKSVSQDGAVFATNIVFGTGGLDKENFKDLESIFYDPDSYDMLKFNNIYDKGRINTECCYFTPAFINPRHKDKDGNSNVYEGYKFLQSVRLKKSKGTNPQALAQEKTEKPYSPSEAFLKVTNNLFPSDALQTWKTEIMTSHIKDFGTYGTFEYLGGDVRFKVDMSLTPVKEYNLDKNINLNGCIVQYEQPYKREGRIPDNLYFICVDPYGGDSSGGGKKSLGVCYVMKNINNYSQPDNCIVASYIARPDSTDDFYKNLWLLAEYYNAKIAFENDRGDGLISYFKAKKLMKWLLPEFELGFNENMPKSTVKRGFGMHMGSGKDNVRKNQGDKYIDEWLRETRRVLEDGEKKYGLHTILDIGLIDELSNYDDGNFDRISALRIGMYDLRELDYKDTSRLKGKVNKAFNSLNSLQLY